MKPGIQCVDAYALIVTTHWEACKHFYMRWLGFRPGFEATWFVWLQSQGERPVSVAFMSPDHPSTPPGPDAFDGRGVLLTLQVADARGEHARLEALGAPLALPLREEPWGQRRFAMTDPAGTWIDVVEQIDPQPGWWDPYVAPGSLA